LRGVVSAIFYFLIEPICFQSDIEYKKLLKKVSQNDIGIKKGDLIEGTSFYVIVDAISGDVLDVESPL